MNDTNIRGIIQQARERRAKWLNLSNRNLSELPPEIGELSDLQVLWLHGNRLTTLPPEIGKLRNLRRLRLHKNRLTELPPEIGQLIELCDLSAYSNQLTALPPEIGQLGKLQRLITANNKIQQLPKEIGQLAELLELNLGNRPRKRKKWGEYLGHNGNKLTELPQAIAQLQNLQSLSLDSNQLTELSPAIAQLQNLQSLSLDSNQLTELPPEIGELADLQVLWLNDNQLKWLPPAVAHLTNLQSLYCNNNQLDSLPLTIAQLTNLQTLSLAGNQLTTLPQFIGQLISLQSLDLRYNNLAQLPPEIAKLACLKSLDLRYNHLTELPSQIGHLTKLQWLILRGNHLTHLPSEVVQLTSLGSIDLADNPINFPPPEIVEQGWNSICAYLSKDIRRVWESKVHFIGEGGAGKTSLLQRLCGEDFTPFSSTTRGVEIHSLILPHPDKPEVAMRLNAWDFGGQLIYHAAHQHLMTNGSLYLIVWNARNGFEQSNIFHWLDAVNASAPQSPVILVATHADERPVSVPYPDLKKRYPFIVAALAVSNKTDEGISELRNKIAEAAASLSLMGQYWPVEWRDVALALRSKAKETKYITGKDMSDLMESYGVTGVGQYILSHWLHELGEILYFQNVSDLSDVVILDLQWVTEMIGRVLESDDVRVNNGVFTRYHMDYLWDDVDPILQCYLVRMMEQFDLSYRGKRDHDENLIVAMLPSLEADYHSTWDSLPMSANCREISMKFTLDHTMPEGLLTWFIAREHRFSTNTHWRYGALLADQERKHYGLIQAIPQDRVINLAVRGSEPHNFFSLLRDGLELIFMRFWGLGIKRTIPCPGHGGKPCIHQFDLEHLEKRLERTPPILQIECPDSLESLSVPMMLFGLRFDIDRDT